MIQYAALRPFFGPLASKKPLMTPMLVLSYLIFPMVIQAAAYHDGSSILLFQLKQKTAPVTDYMTNKLYNQASKMQKRGFIGNLKQELHDYIKKSFTDKGIASFGPALNKEIDNGMNQYYRFTKRDVLLTPQQKKHREEEFSKWLSKRLDAKFKNHMIREFNIWTKGHRRIFKRSTTSNQSKETRLQKRYVERTPLNDWIYMLISSIILLPVFMNPFALGIWGILLSFSSFLLFFNPILTKLTFGTWM